MVGCQKGGGHPIFIRGVEVFPSGLLQQIHVAISCCFVIPAGHFQQLLVPRSGSERFPGCSVTVPLQGWLINDYKLRRPCEEGNGEAKFILAGSLEICMGNEAVGWGKLPFPARWLCHVQLLQNSLLGEGIHSSSLCLCLTVL